MNYFHLGPWAYDSGDYADVPAPEALRVPVDTWQVDLTDPASDE